MSESRDRAMRRSRGTSRSVIDGKVKLERARPAGQYEQVVFPSAESVKEAVLAGVCPYCGKGPFTLLARHTNAQHGIDTKELRDLAGLTYSESITSSTFRERRRQLALGLMAEGRIKLVGGNKSSTPQRSMAGLERMKRKPSSEAPPCTNCGCPTRRKDASNDNDGRVSGGWLRTCSDGCANARMQAIQQARTKPRPPCVICGKEIPKGRGQPGRIKTCGEECRKARRQQASFATQRAQAEKRGNGVAPVRPREETTT